jgi:hypothetical protein
MKVQLNDIRHPDTCGGKEPKHHSPAFNYCRKLLKDDVNSEESLEVYRGDTLAYTISPIRWGAQKIIYENEKTGPTIRKYKESPMKLRRIAEERESEEDSMRLNG